MTRPIAAAPIATGRRADLAGEVILPDGSQLDTTDKRREYAGLAIPEYWLADPRAQALTVLRLNGDRYAEAGLYTRGSPALSPLPIDVAALFAAWPPAPPEPSADA